MCICSDPYSEGHRENSFKRCCILWIHKNWSNTIIHPWCYFLQCTMILHMLLTMSHLHSPCTSSTCLKENWALDGFESRVALELIGVGSIMLKKELKKNKAMKIQAQPRINNSCQSAPFCLNTWVIRTVSLKALVVRTVCCVMYLMPLLHDQTVSSSVYSKVSWCGAKISYNKAVASVILGVILGVCFG